MAEGRRERKGLGLRDAADAVEEAAVKAKSILEKIDENGLEFEFKFGRMKLPIRLGVKIQEG